MHSTTQEWRSQNATASSLVSSDQEANRYDVGDFGAPATLTSSSPHVSHHSASTHSSRETNEESFEKEEADDLIESAANSTHERCYSGGRNATPHRNDSGGGERYCELETNEADVGKYIFPEIRGQEMVEKRAEDEIEESELHSRSYDDEGFDVVDLEEEEGVSAEAKYEAECVSVKQEVTAFEDAAVKPRRMEFAGFGELENPSCHICAFVATSEAEFHSHMEIHFEHKCVMCGYTCRTGGRLEHHISTFHGQALPRRPLLPGRGDSSEGAAGPASGRRKKYLCRHCDFTAFDLGVSWEHRGAHIAAERRLFCPRAPCKFVTDMKHHLDYHLAIHSGEKPFRCDRCEYACVNRSMLNSHMRSHSNYYPYRCLDCSFATKYPHPMKIHEERRGHRRMLLTHLPETLTLRDTEDDTDTRTLQSGQGGALVLHGNKEEIVGEQGQNGSANSAHKKKKRRRNLSSHRQQVKSEPQQQASATPVGMMQHQAQGFTMGFQQMGFPQAEFPQAGFPQTGFSQKGFQQTGFPPRGVSQTGFWPGFLPTNGWMGMPTFFGMPGFPSGGGMNPMLAITAPGWLPNKEVKSEPRGQSLPFASPLKLSNRDGSNALGIMPSKMLGFSQNYIQPSPLKCTLCGFLTVLPIQLIEHMLCAHSVGPPSWGSAKGFDAMLGGVNLSKETAKLEPISQSTPQKPPHSSHSFIPRDVVNDISRTPKKRHGSHRRESHTGDEDAFAAYARIQREERNRKLTQEIDATVQREMAEALRSRTYAQLADSRLAMSLVIDKTQQKCHDEAEKETDDDYKEDDVSDDVMPINYHDVPSRNTGRTRSDNLDLISFHLQNKQVITDTTNRSDFLSSGSSRYQMENISEISPPDSASAPDSKSLCDNIKKKMPGETDQLGELTHSSEPVDLRTGGHTAAGTVKDLTPPTGLSTNILNQLVARRLETEFLVGSSSVDTEERRREGGGEGGGSEGGGSQGGGSHGVSPSTSAEGTSPTASHASSLDELTAAGGRYRHECPHCELTFRDYAMYAMHMGYHDFADPFRCKMCGAMTADKVAFFIHMTKVAHG